LFEIVRQLLQARGLGAQLRVQTCKQRVCPKQKDLLKKICQKAFSKGFVTKGLLEGFDCMTDTKTFFPKPLFYTAVL
jgi:hypothetical protein